MVVLPVCKPVTSMDRSIELKIARTTCGSKPDNVRRPLGGESTCTALVLPNCTMIDEIARTTGCGWGDGTYGSRLGTRVGSGPTGGEDASADGDGDGSAGW